MKKPSKVATVWLGVLALAAAVPLAAQAQVVPVVWIFPGPDEQKSFREECSDAVSLFQEATSFRMARSGDAVQPLTVSYATGGSAQPGKDYEPLAGKVTFPAGASETIIDIRVLKGERTRLVELTLQLVDDSEYEAGDPGAATILFVSHRDEALGPYECGFFFSSEAVNTHQVISIGEGLARLILLECVIPCGIVPAPGAFHIVSGSLPPRITLNADGSFSGSARSPGRYEATIEACRKRPPGTCVTTTLRVDVLRRARTLPATGLPVTAAIIALLVLLGAYAGVVLLGHRRSPRHQGSGPRSPAI